MQGKTTVNTIIGPPEELKQTLVITSMDKDLEQAWSNLICCQWEYQLIMAKATLENYWVVST